MDKWLEDFRTTIDSASQRLRQISEPQSEHRALKTHGRPNRLSVT